VRVPGEGERGVGGEAAGDLYLKIQLTPHQVFERRQQDLHVRVTVPLTTAVLGGEAEVPTLDRRTLRLKIPPGTQNGQVFRLRGHGMPSVGNRESRGDLYATVDVRVPRALTTEQREHYEALARLERSTPQEQAARE
jgi:molecular chaperone DnaJ